LLVILFGSLANKPVFANAKTETETEKNRFKFFEKKTYLERPGANTTIASYSASVEKIYNATNSIAHF
jgi:hypothetical protein